MKGSAPPGFFPHFPVPTDTFIRQAFRSGFPMKRQELPSYRLPTSIYMLHSLPEYPQRFGSSPHGGLRAAGLFPSFSRPRRYLYPAGFPFLLPHEATGISFVPPPHQSFTCCIRCRNIRKDSAPLRMEGSAPPGFFPHFPVPADTFIRQVFRSCFPMRRQGFPSCRLPTSLLHAAFVAEISAKIRLLSA